VKATSKGFALVLSGTVCHGLEAAVARPVVTQPVVSKINKTALSTGLSRALSF
jgi:hypothetical protein